MSEIVLEIAALLLGLFCLFYSVRECCELYLPLPKGLTALLKNQHAVYLCMLCLLTAAALTSIGEVLARSAGAGPGLTLGLRTAHVLLHNLLFFCFALYVLDLAGLTAERGAAALALFALPRRRACASAAV